MPPVDRLADLIVNFGANVQKGQILDVASSLGKEELTRAIVASAYRRGAKFVDVQYWDPHLKRARVEHAADEFLDFVPPWYGERALELGRERGATISLTGPTEPHLYDDLDPERLGRDVFPRVKEYTTVVNERTVNWCVAPCPTAKWAKLAHPDLEPEQAFEKLWVQIIHACRLDEDDPEAAWQERNNTLKRVAERLTERRFDALHFSGNGTDLTIGLLPTSRWIGGGEETVDGIPHMANLPTEEVFTAPDPERVDGLVRATKPLYTQGRIINGLTVRFEREGRIGPLDTVFFDTLLDENAASHIALGSAYDAAAGQEDRPRLNRSSIHIDFMVGAADVDVTGIARDGGRVPVLRDSSWQV